MTCERVPAVIVGAGPVGIVAATLLAQRGIACLILETHSRPYPLPRAVHVDDEVACILRAVGIGPAFTSISRPMPGMRLLNARHQTIAEFFRDTAPGPLGCPRASMFDQPDLEQLLLANLLHYPTVTLRRGCTVTDVERGDDDAMVRYADATGEHNILAQAVLGCDGAGSLVRHAIGASMRDLRFCQRWLVIDVRTAAPLDVWGGVHQICDPHRPATFMHVTGTRYRWEFRLADAETAADLTAPAALTSLLQPWFGPALPADVQIIRHATYTFRAQIADRWRTGRVFLLGDAAHQTPPFIGQGLGAGLRDAHNLAWKLAGVMRGELRDTVLDTYEAERRPHATMTVRTAIAVGWALTGGQTRSATFRRAALAVLCRIPGFARGVLRTASPALGRSILVTRRTGRGQAGRVLACDLAVVAAHPGFTVLGGGRPTAAEARRLAELGVHQIVEPRRRGVVLVRPDGAVAATDHGPAALGRLLDQVQTVTLRPTMALQTA